MTNEEKSLLEKISKGIFDGSVGDSVTTDGGSTVWKAIKNGVPQMFKQGPGSRVFDGKENVWHDGVLHTLQKWSSDDDKLAFLRKFGWLMKDHPDVLSYSAKFKPKK